MKIKIYSYKIIYEILDEIERVVISTAEHEYKSKENIKNTIGKTSSNCKRMAIYQKCMNGESTCLVK